MTGCACSEIDGARQCLIAGARHDHTGQHCQPFDSNEHGVELAIEHLCVAGRQGLSILDAVLYSVSISLAFGKVGPYGAVGVLERRRIRIKDDSASLYSVSQKNTPDIFSCYLNKYFPISIIFGTSIT